MNDNWEERISCSTECLRCKKRLGQGDERILSVYDHQAICMDCKKNEEKRSDYAEVSKMMIGQCLVDTEERWSDPQDFCFYHFYPFKC